MAMSLEDSNLIAELRSKGLHLEAEDLIRAIMQSEAMEPSSSSDNALTPVVHLNGTSFDSLLEQWKHVWRGLDQTLKVMGENSPNGRDYYPKGEFAFQKARDKWQSMFNAIREMSKEVKVVIEQIYDQKK
jgi:hypothetical protein